MGACSKLMPSDALVDSVKRKLAVTWNNESTDALLRQDIIPNSMAAIAERTGLPDGYAFETPGRERSLLLALCFYAYNNAEDEFYENYSRELMAVRDKWRGVANAQEEEASPDLP